MVNSSKVEPKNSLGEKDWYYHTSFGILHCNVVTVVDQINHRAKYLGPKNVTINSGKKGTKICKAALPPQRSEKCILKTILSLVVCLKFEDIHFGKDVNRNNAHVLNVEIQIGFLSFCFRTVTGLFSGALFVIIRKCKLSRYSLIGYM